jgi:putative glutamine amidotransferase
MGGSIVDKLEDADLVVFTGGEDVSPRYYQDTKHPTTSCNPERDSYEIKKAYQAIELGKKLIGVCRGLN